MPRPLPAQGGSYSDGALDRHRKAQYRNYMLVMDVRGLSGEDRAYARFWNHLHSIESALEGVKLGLWLRGRPSLPVVSDMAMNGPLVALAWPRQGDDFESEKRPLREDMLEALDWQNVVAVPLARFELPPEVHQALRQHIGYSPTMDGQVSGWWSEEDDGIPARRPSGALLPPKGQKLDSGSECLVLVDVDDWWGVLSSLGLGGYSFGIRLEAGEVVRFVDEQGQRWLVRLIGDVASHELRDRWGDQAAERARPGAPAVRVTVSAE